MSVFTRRRDELKYLNSLRSLKRPEKKAVLRTCPSCKNQGSFSPELMTCEKCSHHEPIGAYHRLKTVLDSGSFKELWQRRASKDPYKFPGYLEKLEAARKATGLNEAVVTVTGKIGGYKVAVAAMDSRFMMGSMSAEVGEKITLLIEYATKNRLPLIIFSASGGARMQEGILSLMQMAKTSAAIERFQNRGGLYISVLTHPTTGGVTASFASLGDIMLSEPGALIGFAGPRVIEQTIGQKLPEGFQSAEFLLESGFLDAVVPRKDMRDILIRLLKLHSPAPKGDLSIEIKEGG